MDAGGLQRPAPWRLTLIRDLLDRLPDTHVPAPDIDLPPLPGKPWGEHYGKLKPLKPFKV